MSLSKMRVTMPRVYPSNERERRVVRTKDLSVKTTTTVKGKDSHKAASTFCPPEGGKRHARGTRESASGGLLDEGAESADCVCEVGFVKRRQTPVFKKTDPERKIE